MLAELTIIPVGTGSHTSDELAEVLAIIDDSGLPYQLTPSATCIEGDWSAVLPVIQKCHDRVRQHCAHVVTNIKIEDEEGPANKLVANIDAVEAKARRPLQTAREREAGASPQRRFAATTRDRVV